MARFAYLEHMKSQKQLFSLDPNTIYLNAAYMSPMPKSVEEAGMLGLQAKRIPHLIKPEDFFENRTKVRKLFAQLIDTDSWENVAIIPSTSYGIATAARNIHTKPGQNIVMLAEQFPSNVYSWQRLAKDQQLEINIVSTPPIGKERSKLWNENILHSINSKTCIVTMGHVHWADGTTFDLQAIRNRCDEVGAKLIIDGTQSIGALPFSVQKIQPDALVCGAYKWLLGPYAMGLAYYSDEICQGIPLEENWINRKGSENFSELVNYEAEYLPGASRHMVGQSSNFIGLSMMIAALTQLLAWTPQGIQDYCKNISQNAIAQLIEHGHYIDQHPNAAQHIRGIYFRSGTDLQAIKDKVSERKISVSFRGQAMRVSPHVYNDSEDFDALIECFR